MAGAGTAHYLRPAAGGGSPGTVMFLVAGKAVDDAVGGPPGCWSARCVYRRHRRHAGEQVQAAGDGGQALAARVDGWAAGSESAWLYAYDLLTVLNATALAEQLCALGWELSRQFGTSADAMWVVLHKGRRRGERRDRPGKSGAPAPRVRWAHTLTLADAGALAVFSPAQGAAAAVDPGALAGPVLTLMDWWDRVEMGRWSVTGASLGWRAYRSTLRGRSVVIDHDPVIVGFERRAVYGGRRDVAVIGSPGAPRYAELDFEAAHMTIATSCPLPCAYGGPLPVERFDPGRYHNPSVGVIAEVTIRTDRPRWPARVGGRVFYPVGEFRTVLAGPDLADAFTAGAVLVVHEAHWYRMSYHLAPWGHWVRGLLTAPGGDVPEPVRRAAKHWSRAVIGKFAQRGWVTRPWVGPPCDGWVIEQTPILGKTHQVMTIGLNGVYYVSEADQRGEHERPAVLAFVEAHVRSRLSALIAGRYAHAIVQWDTDGMIVSLPRLYAIAAQRGHRTTRRGVDRVDLEKLLRAMSQASWPLVVRCKTIMERMVLYGPQHVVADTMVKLSGVPAGAVQVRPGVFAAEVRIGLGRASPDDPSGVGRSAVAEFTVNGPYAAGWVLQDGIVRPPQARVDDAGVTVLLPWAETAWAAAGDALGPLQALWAAGLW